MLQLLQFLRDRDGATSVEYAVMLALILVACMSAVALVGQQSANLWSDNEVGLQSAFENAR
jgi:pilus assembly protein Flp/PilA